MNGQTLGFGAGDPPGERPRNAAHTSAKHAAASTRQRTWRAIVKTLRSPAGLTRTLFDDLVVTAFPADCRSCEAPLEHAGTLPVCAACLARLTPSTLLGCSRCGEALNLDLDLEDLRFSSLIAEGLLCRPCRLAPPPFARAVSFATYDDELRTLIHLLKFEHVPSAARPLGAHLAEAILTLQPDAASSLLVIAVPLFPGRQRQRGYNQSVLIADFALRSLGRTHPAWKLTAAHGALVRKKRTESQFMLSPRGRRQNLRGAFAVRDLPGLPIQGREILLVDDILTSGATARECARVLLAAGAARVWVATVARAQKRSIRYQQQNPGDWVAAWDLKPDANRTTA